MTGDTQAQAQYGRSGGGRMARGAMQARHRCRSEPDWRGCCRHGQAVLAGGRVLQARERYECACVGRARRGRRRSGGRARAADMLDDGLVLQTRRETGASAGDGRCEAVEVRADGYVLMLQTRLTGRCKCG